MILYILIFVFRSGIRFRF